MVQNAHLAEKATRVTAGSESRIAFDDPVPSTSPSSVYGTAENCEQHPGHTLEAEVQRALFGLEDVEFTSLEVHRIPQGVCLQGTLHSCCVDDLQRIEQAARIEGVECVINRLVVQAMTVLEAVEE